MSEPFIGEIIMFAGNFAPRGWLFCQGQILSIAQNTALFAILGTTYGGNGQTTFALPDLRSRVPVGQGQGSGLTSYSLGQSGGAESRTLLAQNLPSHNHGLTEANAKAVVLARSDAATTGSPAGAFLGMNATTNVYVKDHNPANTALNGGVVQFNPGAMTEVTGGNQPFQTVQPYLCLNFIIAVEGIFPSRN